MRGMVVGEGGRSSGVLLKRLFHFLSHDQIRTTSHFVDDRYDDFRRPFRPNSATCFVRHSSNSPISFMTHWKVMFCLDPICSLCQINSIPPSARASCEISNILVLSNHQAVTASKMRTYSHRYGETKNVRINHPVKGLVHPSCTGN